MSLKFLAPWSRHPSTPELVQIGSKAVPVYLVRNHRARRYVLRVRKDGTARVTIPASGSAIFALAFARRNSAWIERQLEKRASEATSQKPWETGTRFLFRGELVELVVEEINSGCVIRFAEEVIPLSTKPLQLQAIVQGHLRCLAEKELPWRTTELARAHQVSFVRVTVRNQKSRWGSCSAKKTISLNWRLIQAPEFVRDYLIIHELMHLREMNHSKRFWQLVGTACPHFQLAEDWLDAHAKLLR